MAHRPHWEAGAREAIKRMLADGQLQRVPASGEQADRLLIQARTHVTSAVRVCGDDPAGGYALAYDAARMAVSAGLLIAGSVAAVTVLRREPGTAG